MFTWIISFHTRMHVHCMCVRTAMPMHACAHAVPNLTATCIISIGRILAAFSLSLSLSLSLVLCARACVLSPSLSLSLSLSLCTRACVCVCVCARARARACSPSRAHTVHSRDYVTLLKTTVLGRGAFHEAGDGQLAVLACQRQDRRGASDTCTHKPLRRCAHTDGLPSSSRAPLPLPLATYPARP